MIQEYDCVRIKKNGMVGQVVDIRNTDTFHYTVETCVEDKNGENIWALHECVADDLEPAEDEEE